MPSFQYKPRSSAEWQTRENQRGGGYIGFLKDEFKTFQVKKENFIRILPPTWDDARHYGLDLYVHYSVGPQEASVLCPLKMKNQPCPLCEEYNRYDSRGEEAPDGLWATKRVLVWLVDRSDEKNKTPVLWSMPWTVDRDISKLARDRQTGEIYQIDDPEGGYDVSFETDGGTQQRKYIGYQISRRPSSVDPSAVNFAAEHPLTEVLIFRSASEIQELYSGGAAPKEDKPTKVTELVKDQGPRVDTERVPQVTELPKSNGPSLVYCEKGITVKGQKYLCALVEGHPGECDFDRTPSEQAKAAAAPIPEPAKPTQISSRAAELRARFSK